MDDYHLGVYQWRHMHIKRNQIKLNNLEFEIELGLMQQFKYKYRLTMWCVEFDLLIGLAILLSRLQNVFILFFEHRI